MISKNPYLEPFLQLSVYLTAFDSASLQGTGMVNTYLDTLSQKNSATVVDDFFNLTTTILASGCEQTITEQIQLQLMDSPDNATMTMTRQIILMWYTGQWFATPYTNLNNAEQINGQSYVEGLMWPAAQTHPPGAKQPGFASWAEQPITIKSMG